MKNISTPLDYFCNHFTTAAYINLDQLVVWAYDAWFRLAFTSSLRSIPLVKLIEDPASRRL